MDESSTSHFDGGKVRDCRHPSPVSIFEPSFLDESCDSSLTSVRNNSTEGIRSIYFFTYHIFLCESII